MPPRRLAAVIFRCMYGSDRMWQRVVERAEATFQLHGLEPEVERHADVARLWVRGKKANTGAKKREQKALLGNAK